MTKLSSVIESIYSALCGESITVYREYEKNPVSEHEKLYASAGISEIRIENCAFGESGKYYGESFNLHIRIIGDPDVPFSKFYDVLDGKLLNSLLKKDFFLEYVKISAPVYDKGLKRMVLECTAEISGRMEALNES